MTSNRLRTRAYDSDDLRDAVVVNDVHGDGTGLNVGILRSPVGWMATETGRMGSLRLYAVAHMLSTFARRLLYGRNNRAIDCALPDEKTRYLEIADLLERRCDGCS